jgi:hypothetical protein
MTSENAGRMHGDVLLVGSMPFDDAETVFRETAKGLKGHLAAMPDGEVQERKNWVGMLPEFVFQFHPQLEETISPGPTLEQPDLLGVHLSELDPFWAFKVKDGEKLKFDNILYADFAIASYATFKRLRDQGVIEPGTRFQVSLPSPNSAIDSFFTDLDAWPEIHEAYLEATNHEIHRILEVVPANDLSIQFDMAWELVDLATGAATNYFSYWPRLDLEGKIARHAAQLDEIWKAVPDETLLGYHWCYGTWGGWPMADMQDLALCVRMSNEAVKRCGRRLDYVHMPVIKDPSDAFFAPLGDLDIGDTKVYLGLVHEGEDGIEPFRRRLNAAREHLSSFGIGGVCGYGRIDPSELAGVLAVHTACAEELTKG